MIAIIYREGARVGLAYGVEFKEERDYDEQGEPAAYRVTGSAAQLRTLKHYELEGYDFELADAPTGPVTLRGVRFTGPLLNWRQGLSGDGIVRVCFAACEVVTPLRAAGLKVTA